MDDMLMGVRDARRLGQVEAAQRGETTNRKAARALGLSIRQFQRLKRRVAAVGVVGLRHGNHGRVSAQRLDERVRLRVEALLQHEEVRLNDCHIVDLLGEQGLSASDDSVRRIRLALGLQPVHARRPSQHHRRRERREREGSMVLIDGSDHPWLGPELPRLTLVGAIDDATSQVLALTFRPTEDLHGYATVLREVLVRYGMPEVFYGDRTGIAVRNDDHWSLEEELAGRQLPPQFGQMLEALGIRYIAAGSPQAKGRIERLWRTLQDRLLKELRFHEIRTVAAATAYLPGFLERFNRRFAIVAKDTKPAWQKPPRHFELLLACRYTRTVTRDNVVTLPGCVLHLPPGAHHRSHQGRRVEVRELLDGRLLVRDGSKVLLEQPAPAGPFTLVPRSSRSQSRRTSRRNDAPRPPRIDERQAARLRSQAPSPRRSPIAQARTPAKTHPWRKPYDPNLLPAKAGAGG
ncbi:MAG: ISNCY family transposase [Gemmatimonadales bacterium]|nr:MAG: ISNCY family transposase [Gemmatimonadales bacterium]